MLLLVMLNAIPSAAATGLRVPGAELVRHGQSPHRPADHPNPQPNPQPNPDPSPSPSPSQVRISLRADEILADLTAKERLYGRRG